MSHRSILKAEPAINNDITIRRNRDHEIVFTFLDSAGDPFILEDEFPGIEFEFYIKSNPRSIDNLLSLATDDVTPVATMVDNQIFVPIDEDDSNIDQYSCVWGLKNKTSKQNWYFGKILIVEGDAIEDTTDELTAIITLGETVIMGTITIAGGSADEHYRGLYISLAALQTAVPTGEPGDYADVDAGAGTDIQRYIWDEAEGWVLGGGSGSFADITGSPSDNPALLAALDLKADDTDLDLKQTGVTFKDEGVALGAASTVDDVDFLGAGVTAARVGNKVSVTIPGGGGGGTVASFAEALAGTDDTKFVSPLKNAYVNQRVYNVTAYGAKGDAQKVTDGAITSGTAILTSVTGSFTSADVGKYVMVYGAGAAGANLTTTILSYQSATQVTLAANAGTTVSGMDVKWGTESGVGIQAAIQAAFDAGAGVVWIPEGWYLLGNALNATSNSQLYIPGVDYRNAVVPGITIIGEGEPMPWVDQATTGAPQHTSGVVLESTILGGGTRPRVFGAIGNIGGYSFNPCQVEIRNIQIHVRSKTGSTHIAATITAWGFGLMSSIDGHNLSAHIESPMFNSVEPTVSTSIGFELPFINNGANITLQGCVAVGFYYGYELSDHAAINNSWAQHCRSGVNFSNSNQPVWLNQFLAFRCKYAATFTGTAHIFTGVFDIEEETDAGKWYFPAFTFYAPSPVTAYGTITYYKGTDASRSGTFGNVFFVNSQKSQKQMVVGGGTNVHSGGTGEWNGTSFEKAVFEIRGTAEETGTGTQWSDFGMGFKQLGTNALVARNLVVYNDALLSADKRLVDFEIYTDGATNKGRQERYYHDGTAVRLVVTESSDYVKLSRGLIIDNDISPTALAANTDNYAPTGIATAATLRISASSAVDLTGIAGGATMVDGRELTLINVGTTNTITLKTDVTSTAANRFLLNADFALAANMAIKLVYDGTSSRWRKIY